MKNKKLKLLNIIIPKIKMEEDEKKYLKKKTERREETSFFKDEEGLNKEE